MGWVLAIIAFIIIIIMSMKRSKLKNEYDDLKNKFGTINNYNETLKKLRAEEQSILNSINKYELALTTQLIDISVYDNITSEECKNKLVLLKKDVNDIIKCNKALIIHESGSRSKKEINASSKQILLCFNAECANIIDNLTFKNVDTSRSKIQRTYDTINKLFELDGVQLSSKMLELKLEELTLVYAYISKKEQEKEEQKAIREQMLEEEKVRREIEREKAKLEKEETQFKNEITKLMTYMQKADDVQKQLYVDKIKELEEKLKALEKDKENILQREQNTRAGFVYVISNIGSFGEDVYKIGMTRRLEPMDRVKELSDASVPFDFDVHAMIFCDDAPALETTLHQTFKDYQVNKVNVRKEFFKVPLDKIEDVVKKNHNATVTFTKVAKAEQYRASLKM